MKKVKNSNSNLKKKKKFNHKLQLIIGGKSNLISVSIINFLLPNYQNLKIKEVKHSYDFLCALS